MITDIAQAIMTKFNETPGSDALRAALSGGLWFTEAKDDVSFPYGVFFWNGSNIDELAGTRLNATEIASITVSLYSKNDDGGAEIFDIVQKFITAYDWATLDFPGGQAFTIKNTSGDATSATVEVTSTSIILIVVGGTNASSNTLTLSSYATMSDLYTAITALNKGWSITQNASFNASDPTDLELESAAGCLNIDVGIQLGGQYTHLACQRTSATNRGKIDNVWVIDLDYDIWYQH